MEASQDERITAPATQRSAKNGVPVLERTFDLLAILERDPAGVTIRGLTRELDLPRSTVYRILNTLMARRIVRRTADGIFLLGPRLVSLAARVRPDASTYDLGDLALPLMKRLRDELGEPVKLSVRDGDRVVVAAAVLGLHDYSFAPATGTSYPLHAGAASKVIMSDLSGEELEAYLAGPLIRYTPKTFVDATRLRAELKRVKRQQFAFDLGEHSLSAHATAAPIFDSTGKLLGALSIPFLADKSQTVRDQILEGVCRTASAISGLIPKA